MTDPSAIEALRAQLRGELIQPGDADYDAARKVYNGMIDRRPALIARCADVADVIAASTSPASSKLLLAVRGGGHNGAGLGSCDGGLVIDLSRMKRHPRRSERAHRARRGRLHLGRCGPRHACLRAGHARAASSRPPASAG